jgi:hypothetical protein
MASPEELTPLLPETLPDDFGEWDGEASPEASPVKAGEWEAWEAAHSFGEPKSPQGQPADRGSNAAPPAEKPHGSDSAPSAPVVVAQQKHFVEWEAETPPTPKPVDLSEWEAWEAAHGFGKGPIPEKQSAVRETNSSPVVERPRVSGPVPSAPFPVKAAGFEEQAVEWIQRFERPRFDTGRKRSRRRMELQVTPGLPKPAAVNGKLAHPKSRRLHPVDDRALFQVFSEKNVEVEEKPKTAKKKWMIIAPVSAASVLLAARSDVPAVPSWSEVRRRGHLFRHLRKQPIRSPHGPTFESAGGAPAAQTQPAATTAKQSTANTPVDQRANRSEAGAGDDEKAGENDGRSTHSANSDSAGNREARRGECASPGEHWFWRR